MDGALQVAALAARRRPRQRGLTGEPPFFTYSLDNDGDLDLALIDDTADEAVLLSNGDPR